MINYLSNPNCEWLFRVKSGTSETQPRESSRVWMILSEVVGRVTVLTINKTFRKAQLSNVILKDTFYL